MIDLDFIERLALDGFGADDCTCSSRTGARSRPPVPQQAVPCRRCGKRKTWALDAFATAVTGQSHEARLPVALALVALVSFGFASPLLCLAGAGVWRALARLPELRSER